MNKILKNTMILTAITLIAGVALGFVYEITKEPIANAQLEAKQEACRCLRCDHFGYGIFKGGREKLW